MDDPGHAAKAKREHRVPLVPAAPGRSSTRRGRSAAARTPLAQRRRVEPADAVLFQHAGERRPPSPLARPRRRQAPPQVERPWRRCRRQPL